MAVQVKKASSLVLVLTVLGANSARGPSESGTKWAGEIRTLHAEKGKRFVRQFRGEGQGERFRAPEMSIIEHFTERCEAEDITTVYQDLYTVTDGNSHLCIEECVEEFCAALKDGDNKGDDDESEDATTSEDVLEFLGKNSQEREMYVVTREDLYESTMGDGSYFHLADVFWARAEADECAARFNADEEAERKKKLEGGSHWAGYEFAVCPVRIELKDGELQVCEGQRLPPHDSTITPENILRILATRSLPV